MANDKLFIPTKLKVGFQRREDTYSGKLAYVTYFDIKGKLCKEKSWRGWIHETPQKEYVEYDQEKGEHIYEMVDGIPSEDYDNKPTEGFVLNKKAGGYSSGWNNRQTVCRVYDPRGFEFEIGMENLLYILQESNSYKGKGLEGQFVYGWAGAQLVLVPCSGEDYVSSTEFTDLKSMSVHAKTLVEGCMYYTKSQEKVVYLGKFDYLAIDSYRYNYQQAVDITKEYMFLFVDEKGKDEKSVFKPLKVNKLAKLLVDTPVENFAELVVEMENSGCVMPVERVDLTPITNIEKLNIKGAYYKTYSIGHFVKNVGDNRYQTFDVSQVSNYDDKNWYNRNIQTHKVIGYNVTPTNQEFSILNGNYISVKEIKDKPNDMIWSAEQINGMGLLQMELKIKGVAELKKI